MVIIQQTQSGIEGLFRTALIIEGRYEFYGLAAVTAAA